MYPRRLLFLLSCVTLIMFTACKDDEALTLDIPEDGFTVVQHLPASSKDRAYNALYLTPRPIEPNEFNTPQLQTLIDSMYTMMLRKAGVGIAANQLGKRLQIFIIEAKVSNPRYKVLGPVKKQVFINPKITKVSKTRKNFWHGCLSAHGEKRGNVASFEWLEYECYNPQGQVQRGRLDGFAAVIFQHEYRHLMKGTYMDRATHFVAKDTLDQQLAMGQLPFFEIANDSLPLLIEGYELGKALEDY